MDKIELATKYYKTSGLDVPKPIQEIISENEQLRKDKQYLVELFCKQEIQYCHLCEDKSCGDNINKHKIDSLPGHTTIYKESE